MRRADKCALCGVIITAVESLDHKKRCPVWQVWELRNRAEEDEILDDKRRPL